MRAPVLMIAALTCGSAAAAAQPEKDQRPVRASKAPAQVVLASASEVRTPSAEETQPSSTPAKRPIARVTTCRCGDPQLDAEQQEQ
ncbi:MAG: hypothetical protein ACJ8FT_01670 [Sphingomonas sp.]